MSDRLLIEVLSLRFYQYHGTELEPLEFRAFAESKSPQEHYEIVVQSPDSMEATPLGTLIPAAGDSPMRIVSPVYTTWPDSTADAMTTTWFDVDMETGAVTCNTLSASDAADLYELNKRYSATADEASLAAASAIRARTTTFLVRVDKDTHNVLGMPEELRSAFVKPAA